MKRSIGIVLLATVPLLQGCFESFGKRSSAKWPFEPNTLCTRSCTAKDAAEAYMAASEFCRDVHNFYERGGTRAGMAQWPIGSGGTIAGVWGSVAHGSAARGLAALAGAGNALQVSMNDAFSATLELKRQSAVATAAIDGDEAFRNATTDDARVAAAVRMTNGCWMASSKADMSALQSMAVPGKPAVQTKPTPADGSAADLASAVDEAEKAKAAAAAANAKADEPIKKAKAKAAAL